LLPTLPAEFRSQEKNNPSVGEKSNCSVSLMQHKSLTQIPAQQSKENITIKISDEACLRIFFEVLASLQYGQKLAVFQTTLWFCLELLCARFAMLCGQKFRFTQKLFPCELLLLPLDLCPPPSSQFFANKEMLLEL